MTKGLKPFKTVEELNETIFDAISELNSEGINASVSRINKYFEEYSISKKCKSGEGVSTAYLKSLVKDGFLKSEIANIKGKKISVYKLQEQKEIEETEKKEVHKEEKQVKERKVKEKEKEEEIETKNKETLGVLIESGKYLVRCPECNYSCQLDWDHCESCQMPLTENIKLANLV